MGDHDSDLRLRVVKSGPRGELEVVMKRWGQIQDCPAETMRCVDAKMYGTQQKHF